MTIFYMSFGPQLLFIAFFTQMGRFLSNLGFLVPILLLIKFSDGFLTNFLDYFL